VEHRRERNKKVQKDVRTAHFGTSTAKQAACKRPHITNHANKKGRQPFADAPIFKQKPSPIQATPELHYVAFQPKQLTPCNVPRRLT
jgi:hypothetical protein